jgi:ADP-L-glycero-D-manno-heptose 6-epimerase
MIVVTGGAGFIGSNLVAALAERGRRVVVCDLLGRDERWRNLAKHAIDDLIRPEALMDFLASRGDTVEAVFHMGANSSTMETDGDAVVATNIRPTLDLWRWCAANGTRLIYASSAATYGDGSLGFDDSMDQAHLAALRPLNLYGWSKHMVDRHVAREVAEGGRLPPQWAGLKFFNVYGPNEYHKGGMRSLAATNWPAVRDGGPIRLFKSYRHGIPDGGQMRDFIHVGDCVAVMLFLLDTPRVSGLFNVGTGQARSFADLARAIFAGAGLPERIEYIEMPEALRERYQYFTEARMDRLRQAGFGVPFRSLEDGIADYVRGHLAAPDPYR